MIPAMAIAASRIRMMMVVAGRTLMDRIPKPVL